MARSFSFGALIHAPASQVWRTLTDTATWPLWGPSIRKVDFPQRFISANAQGRIQIPLGIWVPFTVERYEPKHYWDWRVGGIHATGHRLVPVAQDQTMLYFTVPAWAAVYGIICRIALVRIRRLTNK